MNNIYVTTTMTIGIRSSNLDNLTTAYNFTLASLNNTSCQLEMLFFYQEGCLILLNSAISNRWADLIMSNKLNALICKGSCSKRGLFIRAPFKSGRLLEFINCCDSTSRVIQF